ncbi:ABC transporter substrate-binding protein [uncultured Vibrio sp.]|uniref:ABC transporter substrate-binding protein n=1 Tax=uncultured Vibrio sp. TaxID=114054 RepID=UPI002634870A|nr:ABC transporter substrate-binding protein [uncultured Vibrio sp.]
MKVWTAISVGIGLCCLSVANASPSVEQRLKSSELLVRGAADIEEIRPLLVEFRRRNPDIELTYIEESTIDLYHNMLSGEYDSTDVIASSAMDLQVKLVNDGNAQPYLSLETQSLPSRAKWRNEIFAFTYEPAVIAYNHQLLETIAKEPVSELQTRADMLEFIRNYSDQMDGLIGTFDIDSVGVGYLLWSYDSQQTASYGRILESFGIHNAKLYSSSKAMLDALNKGKIAFAYNVLGTYANSVTRSNPHIKLLLPKDYTTAIMRTAFIKKDAPNPYAARRYIDFLLSINGQQILAESSSLSPIRTSVTSHSTGTSYSASNNHSAANKRPADDHHLAGNSHVAGNSPIKRSELYFQQERGPIRSIPLGLRLLIMTDKLKREVLINEWKSALIVGWSPEED